MSDLFNEMMEEIYEKNKKIIDLEAKLAESEKKLDLEKYAPVLCIFTGRSCGATRTIDQLKQQLAEKENELEKLNAVADFYKSYYVSFHEKTIAELEKVKEYYISNVQWTRHKGLSVLEFIDQQINELKGE